MNTPAEADPTTKVASQNAPQVEEGVRRIDRKYLTDSILGAFYLEKGLLFTIKMLFVDPARVLREFLFTDQRSRYTKPLGFLILSSSIAAIIVFSFSDHGDIFLQGFNEGFETGESMRQQEEVLPPDAESGALNEEDSKQVAKEKAKENAVRQVGVLTSYYSQNFNLFLIIYVPFCALFCHLFFRKDKWYFTEHLVSNAYLISIQNVISLPFFLLAFLSPLIMGIYVILGAVYQVYFYNRVYMAGRGVKGILRIMAVISLSSVCYMIFLIILMVGALIMTLI
ncbi:DUF3667 domain-containing protein [Roseivirga sp. BDSF3-8]|uniref:DUF3667 domain-containing protein n=1 Tax=Roseivirga sp. BDSF3-8 TaxID=3241598 RepID=UPI0035326E6A